MNSINIVVVRLLGLSKFSCSVALLFFLSLFFFLLSFLIRFDDCNPSLMVKAKQLLF
jgi:hypothetical protein